MKAKIKHKVLFIVNFAFTLRKRVNKSINHCKLLLSLRFEFQSLICSKTLLSSVWDLLLFTIHGCFMMSLPFILWSGFLVRRFETKFFASFDTFFHPSALKWNSARLIFSKSSKLSSSKKGGTPLSKINNTTPKLQKSHASWYGYCKSTSGAT